MLPPFCHAAGDLLTLISYGDRLLWVPETEWGAKQRTETQPFLSATWTHAVSVRWRVISAESCIHFQFQLGAFGVELPGCPFSPYDSLIQSLSVMWDQTHLFQGDTRAPAALLPCCRLWEFSVHESNLHPEIEQDTIFKPSSEFPGG